MPFTVQIPVKSYIKTYIENNCGSPADLTQLPEINSLFLTCLKFPRFNRDKQIKCNYTHSVEIIISKDHFYRYGWQLSKTDIVHFNARCEAFIKFNSRQFIMANASLGIPVSKSIRDFQTIFKFSEDSFSYDAIKKDFDRHGAKIPLKFDREYKQELFNIFMESLSTLGTVSKSFKYEPINKT